MTPAGLRLIIVITSSFYILIVHILLSSWRYFIIDHLLFNWFSQRWDTAKNGLQSYQLYEVSSSRNFLMLNFLHSHLSIVRQLFSLTFSTFSFSVISASYFIMLFSQSQKKRRGLIFNCVNRLMSRMINQQRTDSRSLNESFKDVLTRMRLFLQAEYLQAVDILLTDEAVTWAETTLSVSELLKDSASTSVTVAAFKSLFTQKYPAHVLKTPAVSFNSEIADLRQFGRWALTCLLQAYCKPVVPSWRKGPASSRNHSSRQTTTPPLEAAMLDTVMRGLCEGSPRSWYPLRRTSRPRLCWSLPLLESIPSAEESRRAKSRIHSASRRDGEVSGTSVLIEN